jgi:hypothetical protein
MIHGALIVFQREDGTTEQWYSVKNERDRDVVELKAEKYAERKSGRLESFTGEYSVKRLRRFETADDFNAERRGFDSAREMKEELDRRATEKYEQ